MEKTYEANSNPLDSAQREDYIHEILNRKKALRRLYQREYQLIMEPVNKSSSKSQVIELGSGGGFLKEMFPEVTTSDIIEYAHVDIVFDARKMPFKDKSLKAIVMKNVFHHIPDAEAFLSEAQRCLEDNGVISLIEPHVGPLTTFIYKYFHHEPYLPNRTDWKFESTGPLSDANAALAWVVFKRDHKIFQEKFPHLKLKKYRPRTPFLYWMCGGLKSWNLVPKFMFRPLLIVDDIIVTLFPFLGTFAEILVVKESKK